MKILNFLLRMVFGAVGIKLINAILISQNISIFVGLNLLTLLTVGSLGISGLGLLYGIAAFGIL
ncbi:pro-sigmaK processing inhibitor BofA family protein [Anaerosacchariphilus sp. NSJ-68]|uniref:Pro-sigmaK processing inhibitor BofA family protein n=2 Tax=Lachnospiraceae TaxID=186803 RepID=A0A923LEM3_9FIRM|nr:MULTISPECIES: pro-sigmaK processing inhibitor BofA family protein [Lachnospiraceae]MBC5660740.1 pro-sigmaK processing inhibitor BofA family protein [Anaerosacchariphilus hominis]MBC5697961.1 pro-sigmaK processing inhibitor BofA family protein [Roseburia difficilis]